MAEKNYNLSGPDGATTFMNLPEGVVLQLSDGSRAELLANPHDGAYVLVKYIESAGDASLVGQERPVFFNEVKSVE